jgi:hypothetical protein
MKNEVTGTVIALLLGGLAALALWALRAWKKRLNGAEDAEIQTGLDTLAAVSDWLEPVLFALVTRAERELGGGVGRLKLADVIAKAADLLPDTVKGLVDAEWLAERAEAALEKARAAWAENPKLLG